MLKLRNMVTLFASCLALFVCAGVSAQCHPPRFRKGQDYGGSVFLSVAPRDFTVEKLICLGQTLRKRRKAETFGVMFFSSYEAAKYFRPPVEGRPPRWAEWARQLHATYSFDGPKREESLDIIPLGYESGPSLDTRITLPLGATPHCRVQIQGRCLKAVLRQNTYPAEALKAKASGKVVLTGRIGADGSVAGIQVIEAGVNPGEEKDVLANAALQNLVGWQFDAGQGENPIRITYSYAIDVSLSPGSQPQMQLDLPNRVMIRGNPPE
jgi:TonB family protein